MERKELFDLICSVCPDLRGRALDILSEEEKRAELERIRQNLEGDLAHFINQGAYEEVLGVLQKIGRALNEKEKCVLARKLVNHGECKNARTIVEGIYSTESKIDLLTDILKHEITTSGGKQQETAREILDLLLSPSQHLPHTPESY